MLGDCGVTMRDIERRTYDVELRAADGGAIVGYAAVFNSESRLIGGAFKEVILPGAFKRAVVEDDVRALWNHDQNYVLGRTKSGTLRLREDDHGLHTETDPPDTQWARDFRESIRRGDVDQMSFSFKVPEGGDRWEQRGRELVRYVSEVELFDISPVTFPAYEATTVSARALAMSETLNQDTTAAEDAGAGAPAVDGDGEQRAEARRRLARLRLELSAKQFSGDDE